MPSPLIPLPVDEHLGALCSALRDHSNVVLSAPPGSGKTTRVPPGLLQEPWLKGQAILMLEPRRLATRAAARRMAEERGEAVGQTIGYRVRYDNRVSAQTRVEVVTEAILTRRIQNDPELAGVGLVIFDEFHERNLHSDLGLALCLDVQSVLRDDLKILVMSATLDAQRLMTLLPDVAQLEAPGRMYPVQTRYLTREPSGDAARQKTAANMAGQALDGIRRALREETGDVLAFLPGAGEIRRVEEGLASLPEADSVVIHPLYGDLESGKQDAALLPDPQGRRKVVLATAIAETSLTIPGVRVVVDSGWARVAAFDPASGLTRLVTQRVSRASATQRRGRAGRTEAGVCYRLWTKTTQAGLIPHPAAEIEQADLAPLVLELALWNVQDPAQLPWLDAPPAGHYAQARELLTELGLLDDQARITALGRKLMGYAAHPRLSVMMETAREQGCLPLAADLAAVLTERDPLRVAASGGGPRRPLSVDISLRFEALAAFRRGGRNAARGQGADPAVCAQIQRSSEHWRRTLKVGGRADTALDEDQLALLLAVAYPDRIAQLRDGEQAAGRFLLSGGRGAMLAEQDPLARQPWLVVPSMDAGQGEARVQLAVQLSDAALAQVLSHFADRSQWREQVIWNPQTNRVEATRQHRLGALVLETQDMDAPDSSRVSEALLGWIREQGLSVLGWGREEQTWRARVMLLRQQDLDSEGHSAWPDVSDQALLASLEQWLLPFLDRVRSHKALQALDWAAIFQALLGQSDLGWQGGGRLDQQAPTHYTVPSGSRIRIDYQIGKPPVLAVRLQEMFGLSQTPAIVDGRLALLLHLLSPAQRPIQVTADLASFWANTYAEVRKELKGRYPKHVWPDDPLTAEPTRRAKPRKR